MLLKRDHPYGLLASDMSTVAVVMYPVNPLVLRRQTGDAALFLESVGRERCD
jgi:hypothetical protein